MQYIIMYHVVHFKNGKLAGSPVSLLGLPLPLLIPGPAPWLTNHHGVYLVGSTQICSQMPRWEMIRACDQSTSGSVFSHSCFSCSYVESLLNQVAPCSLIILSITARLLPLGPDLVWATGIFPGHVTHFQLTHPGRVPQVSFTGSAIVSEGPCDWVRRSFLPNHMVCCGCRFVHPTSPRENRDFNLLVLNPASPRELCRVLSPRPCLLRSRSDWATCASL